MNIRTLNTNITKVKFQNSHIVYENFIKCSIKDYEFNLSYNPTLLSGSQAVLYPFSDTGSVFYNITGSKYFGILKDFVTGSISGSEFSPYVTAVGLYNDAQELLAIAKLSAPMPISSNSDMTFLIKYDTQWTPKPYFTPSVTPSFSPSISPSISITPTITPSISATPTMTPTVTPSISTTPTQTPSISVSVTPSISVSVTPSISVSPSITPSVTPSTSTPAGGINVYAKYINSSDEIGYSINGGPYLAIGTIPSTTCTFISTITGLTNGDSITFTTLTSKSISGSTTDCPVSAGGCSYLYTYTGGTVSVYITIDGSDNC